MYSLLFYEVAALQPSTTYLNIHDFEDETRVDLQQTLSNIECNLKSGGTI